MFSYAAYLLRSGSFIRFLCNEAALIATLLAATPAVGQLEVPTRIILNGSASEDRQLTGLSSPVASSDGMSLGAVRSNATTLTTVTGTSAFVGSLTPPLAEYSTGMVVTIIPSQMNASAVTLELNGLGPRFIVNGAVQPLAAGDLRPGIPAHLLYDGTYFQLVSSTQLPCRDGYSAVNLAYCIEDSTSSSATFFQAISDCAGRGARLCTISEWSRACTHLPGFLNTVVEAEWVDHAANNTNGAKLVGYGINGEDNVLNFGCDHGGQNQPTVPYRYRCCTNR